MSLEGEDAGGSVLDDHVDVCCRRQVGHGAVSGFVGLPIEAEDGDGGAAGSVEEHYPTLHRRYLGIGRLPHEAMAGDVGGMEHGTEEERVLLGEVDMKRLGKTGRGMQDFEALAQNGLKLSRAFINIRKGQRGAGVVPKTRITLGGGVVAEGAVLRVGRGYGGAAVTERNVPRGYGICRRR